ncbi:MAG: sulfatase [Polyangiaceae bacterium]|jgi:arylsulfatase A-like enzyme
MSREPDDSVIGDETPRAPRRGDDEEGRADSPGDAGATAARRASGVIRLLRTMGDGARIGAGAAVGVWCCDVVLLAPVLHAAGWRRWLIGMGAAFLVSLTTAVLVGALLAPVFGPAMPLIAQAARTLRARLARGDREAQHALATGWLAAIGLASLWAGAGYELALSAQLAFARPDSIAAALVASGILVAAAVALASPAAVGLARALVEGASHVRGLRWLIARPWGVPCVMLGWVMAGGWWLFRAHGAELAAYPWHGIASCPGALVGGACAVAMARMRPPRKRRLARAGAVALALGLVGAIVAGAQLRPESTTARRLAFDAALSGRIGYAAWTQALDFDGDGQISVLGGGDCAPFDPRRHRGAVEIPGNGVDEDCDGTDLPAQLIRPRPRMQVGQEALPLHPDIVLVTIDALAAHRLMALGSAKELMPHLDALAARGMVFTHCFSQGPSTRLSFPSIFTSRWDSQLTHVYSTRMPYSTGPSDRELQEMLDDAGYATEAVVPASYFGRGRWASLTRGFQQVDDSAVAAGKNNAPRVTDAALRVFLSAKDRPQYLWVHYYDAHGPYVAIPGVAYANRTEELLYEGELTYIDHEIGRLIDAIEARSQPTYLIVTADHGTVFSTDPTRKGHYGYDLYTETLHVPLIIEGPGIPVGRADGVVTTMDIAPTITDLLRLYTLHSSGSTFEGTSLLPEMLTGTQDPNRVVFSQFYLPERGFQGKDPLQMISARNARYNLVLNRASGTFELFDWTTDYSEHHELYEDEARSPEVVRLRSQLRGFLHQFAPQASTLTLPPPNQEP